MPERMKERIDRKISGVNDTLYSLTKQILELKDEHGVDMWGGAIAYPEEKKEMSE